MKKNMIKKILITGGILTAFATTASARESSIETCQENIMENMSEELTSLLDAPAEQREAYATQLSKKLDTCDSSNTHAIRRKNYNIAVNQCGAKIAHIGWGAFIFSEMSCAGYDPQRRMFTTPIKANRYFFPLAIPEYVYHCILHPESHEWVYVGHDSVNRQSGGTLSQWQFGVVATAKRFRPFSFYEPITRPLTGMSRRARNIHSFFFDPAPASDIITNRVCHYRPTFGTVLNYNIKLDGS